MRAAVGAFLPALSPAHRTPAAVRKHRRLEPPPPPQPINEAELTRRIDRSTKINAVIAVCALSAVHALQDPALQGWSAAAGAALVFGGSSASTADSNPQPSAFTPGYPPRLPICRSSEGWPFESLWRQLPAKHPAVAAAGTLGFQLWVTVGNAALSLLVLLILRGAASESQTRVSRATARRCVPCPRAPCPL